MYRISRHQVMAALTQVVTRALLDGESVHVEGLGTFSADRQPSTFDHDDAGRLVMAPPRTTIGFTPDA